MIEPKQPVLKLFGEIAVERGFCTTAEVQTALAIQAEQDRNGQRELIGIIMLKNNILTNEQLIEILKTYDDGIE